MAVSRYTLNDSEWSEINPGAVHILLQVRSGAAILIQMTDVEPAVDDVRGIIISNDFEPKIAISDIPVGESIWAKAVAGTEQIMDTLWS